MAVSDSITQSEISEKKGRIVDDEDHRQHVIQEGKYNHNDATDYQKCKEHTWRDRIELYTTMDLVGDLTGKKVVDMACGDGWLTRELAKNGASQVVGTDLSPDMVALAKQKETSLEAPLGIEYVIEDALAEEGPVRDVDLVTANWLLVNARNRSQLGRFCQSMARQVKSGGRLVTVIVNPELYTWQHDPPQYQRYGFEAKLPDEAVEGAAVLFTFDLGEGSSMTIQNYYFPAEVYLSELCAAGFRDVSFHPVKIEPAPSGVDEGGYWDELIRKPIMVAITGTKE